MVVLDEDRGLSGTSRAQRTGWQRLLTAIRRGTVGIVLVPASSRLSRLPSDWHRVLELGAVFQTLIAEAAGRYDPRDPHDRRLRGLQGTLFAAARDILRHRLRGTLLNKARGGELVVRLPVGQRRLPDGPAVLEADAAVRQTLQRSFEPVALRKNARALQRYFYHHQLTMPRLGQAGADSGCLRWVTPTEQMIPQVLTNPPQAGVFGQGRRPRAVQPGEPPVVKERRLPVAEGEIVVPPIQPAWIAYHQELANRRQLRDNRYPFATTGRGAARDGRALLQGRLLWGRCGRPLTVSAGNREQVSQGRRAQLYEAEAPCPTWPVPPRDQALSELLRQALAPAQLDLARNAWAALDQERQGLARHWQWRLERARYHGPRAPRQYDAVAPETRLGARALARRWNDALAALQQLEQDDASVRRTELAPRRDAAQAEGRRVAQNLPAVWQAATTQPVDRQRWWRLTIPEITVTVAPPPPRGRGHAGERWRHPPTPQAAPPSGRVGPD